MKATLWPNGLGWDVGDNAEVWKLATGLAVCILMDDCRFQHLFIADVSLDPVTAVERCQVEGTIEEDYETAVVQRR